MKQNIRSVMVPCMVALLFVFVSCETSPDIMTPSFSVTLESEASLKNSLLGAYWSENPYLEPSGIFTGMKNEFVVLRMNIELPVATDVDFTAYVQDSAGKIVAEYKDLDSMRFFWSNWMTDQERNNQRSVTLTQTYAPRQVFTARKGTRSYYIVLMGKNPLPRPATVFAQVYVKGLESQTFEWELPPHRE